MMNRTFLSLGSNLGDRSQYLQLGIDLLKQSGQVGETSAVYETEPWGCNLEINFYNQVIEFYTGQEPWVLLETIHEIEKQCGRDHRNNRYAARTMDIDILLYGDSVLQLPELVIPHPHMHQRRFVLVPLTEIAPLLIHPVFQQNMEQLLKACSDEKKILQRFTP
jgi:2-amino-4-hydroxy-6-hydroxymethyldihydropteridine diphosphokinase